MGQVLKGIIFDLDGVITDTARYHYLAWKRLADELKIPFDETVNHRLKGIDRQRSLEIILEAAQVEIDRDEQVRLANVKNSYYQEFITGMTPEDLLPGAMDLLQKCKTQGIKTGLASASRNAAQVIAKLELAETFDVVADAARIQHGKPNPEIFLTVQTQLGIATESCLGVEDAADGVRAIKAAGMFAVGVGEGERLREADEVIADLTQFNLEKYQQHFLAR